MLVGAVVKVVLGLIMLGILAMSLRTHFSEVPSDLPPKADTPEEMSF